MSDWSAWRLHIEMEGRLRLRYSESKWRQLLAMHNPPDVSAGELFKFACDLLGSGRSGYDPDPTRLLKSGTRCAVCGADVGGLAAGQSCAACQTSVSDPRQIWGHVVASIVAASGAAPTSVRRSTLLTRDLGMNL